LSSRISETKIADYSALSKLFRLFEPTLRGILVDSQASPPGLDLDVSLVIQVKSTHIIEFATEFFKAYAASNSLDLALEVSKTFLSDNLFQVSRYQSNQSN
jgi:hypothetical protein